jgi:hypothetical protein
MAWGPWWVHPKIFLHHFENWDKHWNTGILGEYALEEQWNNMLSTMNYSDAGVGDEGQFRGILDVASTIKQQLWLLGSFVSSIRDIIGFKSPAMYLASFFPPFAISLVQSTMSSNANGLFGLDPKKNHHWYFLDSGPITKQCNAKDFRLF